MKTRPTITETPLCFSVFKDELPAVKTGTRCHPYVEIRDPDNAGETIHFIALPGDDRAHLLELAAAYLALAHYQGAGHEQQSRP